MKYACMRNDTCKLRKILWIFYKAYVRVKDVVVADKGQSVNKRS